MKKFIYHIKGVYPEFVETNVQVLEVGKSTKSEFKPVLPEALITFLK